jgi:hypothetical protein
MLPADLREALLSETSTVLSRSGFKRGPLLPQAAATCAPAAQPPEKRSLASKRPSSPTQAEPASATKAKPAPVTKAEPARTAKAEPAHVAKAEPAHVAKAEPARATKAEPARATQPERSRPARPAAPLAALAPVRVLSGDEEGLFAWVGANYAAGSLQVGRPALALTRPKQSPPATQAKPSRDPSKAQAKPKQSPHATQAKSPARRRAVLTVCAACRWKKRKKERKKACVKGALASKSHRPSSRLAPLVGGWAAGAGGAGRLARHTRAR